MRYLSLSGIDPFGDTHKNSKLWVLLTLLALDVQTLRKGYKVGLEVDLLQRHSMVVVH